MNKAGSLSVSRIFGDKLLLTGPLQDKNGNARRAESMAQGPSTEERASKCIRICTNNNILPRTIFCVTPLFSCNPGPLRVSRSNVIGPD